MCNLHHPNIIEMLDSFETPTEVVVVTEYADGELFLLLQDDRKLSEETVQTIATHLVSALYYLHSHRILHRDMKPQNILLGQNGIVKLCDFGFARFMSMETLVLTSIKGTPLYMAPELVEEKPYDHTADLWALGCILYECFTGQPPFPANSLVQLINQITRDSVRWPKDMSSEFRDFLRGLLIKNSRDRLSWPALLEHPFVKGKITIIDADTNLQNPFTISPTESVIFEKERQVKMKVSSRGPSKLMKAVRHEQDSKKPKGEAFVQQAIQPQSVTPVSPAPASHQDPSAAPSPGNLSSAISDKVVSVSSKKSEVTESQKASARQSTIRSQSKNFRSVQLQEEEVDSDDEWQSLIQLTSPDSGNKEPSVLNVIKDPGFILKLKSGLDSSRTQVMEGLLVGAARLKRVLEIIVNVETSKEVPEQLLSSFNESIGIPMDLLRLTEQILQASAVKEQTWCRQILIDLVYTLHMHFKSAESSITAKNVSPEGVRIQTDAGIKFVSLAKQLLAQSSDVDLRLREHALLCLVCLNEVMESMILSLPSGSSSPEKYYNTVAEHRSLLEAIFACSLYDDHSYKELESLFDGNVEMAQQRMDDIIVLGLNCLTSLIYQPVQLNSSGITRSKSRLALVFGAILCDSAHVRMTNEYLRLIEQPLTSSLVLKVIYYVGQQSKSFCSFLVEKHSTLRTLVGILLGQVDLMEEEVNIIVEMVIYLLAVIVIQLDSVPPELGQATSTLISLIVEPQLVSHTTAGLLMLSQLVIRDTPLSLNTSDVIASLLVVFSDLNQIYTKSPFDFGVLDGAVMMLSHIMTMDPGVSVSLVESGLLFRIWDCLFQILRISSNLAFGVEYDPTVASMPLEVDTARNPPDWTVLSFKGLVSILTVTANTFVKEPLAFVGSLAKTDDIISMVLIYLLSQNFLEFIKQNFDPNLENEVVAGVVLQVVHLFCFPFAVDTEPQLLQDILKCYSQLKVLPRLFQACMLFLKAPQLDLPVGLMSRLVLTDDTFVEQFVTAVNNLKGFSFLTSCLAPGDRKKSLSVSCETINICNHLVRTSSQNSDILCQILGGSSKDYRLLEALLMHSDAAVRTRTCSLIGNMFKHSDDFSAVLCDREKLLSGLLSCLADDDQNVRKVASYALGNAAFHSSRLYPRLRPAVPHLVRLLQDQLSKTRSNAAGALGNLALNSSELCKDLIQHKAVSGLLELACNDSQYCVQERVLISLRTISSQPLLKEELIRLDAVEKLRQAHIDDELRCSTAQLGRSTSLSRNYGRQSATTLVHQRHKIIDILTRE